MENNDSCDYKLENSMNDNERRYNNDDVNDYDDCINNDAGCGK